MAQVKINNKNYRVPELNFEHSQIMEQCGLPVEGMMSRKYLLTAVKAFTVIVTKIEPEYASDLIQQHIMGGGGLEDIYLAYVNAIQSSGFFQETPPSGQGGEEQQEIYCKERGTDSGRVTFSGLIHDIWLPAAIRFGIAADVFWTLNPKLMYLYQEEHIKEKQEEIKFMDASAYYHGLYVKRAIASCFNKNTKYPKKPLSFEQEEKKKLATMTEEEYYAAMRSAIAGMNSQFSG